MSRRLIVYVLTRQTNAKLITNVSFAKKIEFIII